MKRLYFQHLILSGTLVLSLGACVHKPTKTMKAGTSIEAASPPPQRAVLLQEARIESDNLRAELASLKILTAKQMGELQSLRKQSQSIQHREQDQGQELQNIRSQLLSSQAERDQLRKQNMELKGQVASMPDMSQLVTDIQALHGSFQQIMNSMKRLTSDMQLIKQEMRMTTTTPKPQQTHLRKSLPTEVTMANQLAPDTKGRIIIQEGDTLWELSRTYRVSVEQLREWNHISGDLIMTGLHLKVAEPMETVEAHPENVNNSTKSAAPMVKEENLDTQVQEIPQPTVKAAGDIPSPPTHILSIANPQSDSHEAP